MRRLTLSEPCRQTALNFALVDIAAWRRRQGMPDLRRQSRREALYWLRVYRSGIFEIAA